MKLADHTRFSALAGAALGLWMTAVSLAWLTAPALATEPNDPTATDDDRVVAVGDVHGSIEGLTAILRESGLLDGDNHWIGGTATLVQTGDLLDRGTHLKEVMDLLISLQPQAQEAGGRVVVLLGNHETMNLLGMTRDVNRDAFAEFVDEHSKQRQSEGWAAFKTFWGRRMPELGLKPVFSDEAKNQWLVMHPLGFLEYVEAIGPDGRYGSWLRRRPAAVIVGDTLFIHGGYGPFLDGVTVEEINLRVADEIATFDRARAWMVAEGLALPWYSVQEMTREAQRELLWIADQNPTTVPAGRLQRAEELEFKWDSWYLSHPEGPFWFRGASGWTEEENGAMVGALLDQIGVARQVVGHTPQSTAKIEPRIGNRVFMIDTGMLTDVYGGRPSALEIVGDTITAIYPGERQLLQTGGEAAPGP